MSFTIRWKLMASYLLLLLVMGGALLAFLNRTLTGFLVNDIRESLGREADLAALIATGEAGLPAREATEVAAEIGRRLGARVTIMTAAGEVVGDSEVSPQALREVENHLGRPEVQQALVGGVGSAIRHSATIGTDMLYVARLLEAGAPGRGIIRLALPLAAVDRAKAGLYTVVLGAVALAAFLSILLSYVLSNVTSRTLRDMAAGALRIGAGDFSRRLPVRSRDELGELALVLNEMADRLQQQMSRLNAEKNRLGTILRGMGEGLLVTDEAGTVTLVNPAFRTFFGLGGEVTGRPLYDISRHPLLHETWRAVVASGAERTAEVTIPGERGKVLLTHWVPLLEEEKLSGVVAVFHDISDLKRLERIRRDFVANVSHELRTPVSVIKGYAETLAADPEGIEPATAARFLAVIQAHAQRLAHLIEDLLTLSSLEAADSALELTPCSLAGVVRRSCSLLEPKAAGKQVSLQCEGLPEVTVLADPGRLEQVLVNLLDNAVKYTPAGGRVTVRAETAGDLARISVSDTGPGIPPHALPRLFERFYRVDAGRSREEGGTGLGLAIVKHIVQLHGGSVAVESTPGRGSTFHVELLLGRSSDSS